MQKLKISVRDVFEKALTNVVGFHCVAGALIWIPNETACLFTLHYLCDIHTALQTYFINKICL